MAASLALLTLALRLLVHIGRTPSGVDTWYYLASADQLRRTRRLPISLPQYLLQDRTESYAPGFIVLLALLPRGLLVRNFWLVSPLVDTLHVLILYAAVYRLTDSVTTAALGGLIFAVVPQLVAETRSLNPRSLGTLLLSVSLLLMLRVTIPEQDATGLRLGATPAIAVVAAVFAMAALLLTQSATGAVALAVASTTLAMVYADWRYIALPVAGAASAVVITRGFYGRILWNLWEAVRFWRRNVHLRGAEPIRDSPIYAEAAAATARPMRPRRKRWEVFRLFGENPFVVPMALTPPPATEWWGGHMYSWAIGVLAWATATTFVPGLRILGPGYMYLKASVFPTAVTLALTIGPGTRGVPYEMLLAGAVVLSTIAIGIFVVYTRRRATERTSSVPADLITITRLLSAKPQDGVLVLPFMYADYVSYNARKSVLWGGHSGDLTRFEDVFPVVRRPFPELIERYGLKYALLDLGYVDLRTLRLSDILVEVERSGPFSLYEVKTSSH